MPPLRIHRPAAPRIGVGLAPPLARISRGRHLASGEVDGVSVAPRRLYWERFVPPMPNGKTVLIAPGYLSTGETFRPLVEALLGKGYQVVTMDQQWAGKSDGVPGEVDRGYGVTRDVAAMAALAAKMSVDVGGRRDGRDLVIVGASLGGGPGAFGALVYQAQGRLKLDGLPTPSRASAVLLAPYFATRPNHINRLLAGIPAVRDIDFYMRGNLLGHPYTPDQTIPDTARIVARAGPVPGHVALVMSKNDLLADPNAALEAVRRLGQNVSVDLSGGLPGHVSAVLRQLDRVVQAVDRAAGIA